MTREEKLKAIQEVDAVIERAERACQSYELMRMEMMATLVRAKAIHKQLIAKKAELVSELNWGEGTRSNGVGAMHESGH